MLSPRQFELVGRITILFNEIEFTLTMFIPFLIGPFEFRMGEMITANARNFSEKTRLVRQVLDCIVETMPSAEQLVGDARAEIKKADDLAIERNTIAHALLSPIFSTTGSRVERFGLFRVKQRTEIACDEAQLEELSNKVSASCDSLRLSLHKLVADISQIRVASRFESRF